MDDAAEAIAAAVRATAPAMSVLSVDLDACLVETNLAHIVAGALRTTGRPRIVKCEYNVDFAHWQPKIGKVDAAVVDPGDHPHAFVELKWGASTLYNCIWDLAKMATAVAEAHAVRSFLVAGAPEADWAGSVGYEVFDDRHWSARDLFAAEYLPGWIKWWAEVKTRPQSLPSDIATRKIASAEMTIRTSTWFLRVAEVTITPGCGWVPVPQDCKSAFHWRW